ncbi:hypothetical protein OEZ85_005540 [Tetradesmus obliquus]|uniref:Amino acid transporter transmembrane domain-containing protein n=1 Tax=Tetradesmus obliquus TaxID=3088 RepID=A0ABY8UEA2_TETOB|nr:hypothetical protein OEZ85_005540 [Tetradesmus obliquus]
MTAPSVDQQAGVLNISKSVEDDGQVCISEDESVKRTAGWTDVAYHSVTAMVGAGVLGLPSAFSHLGWAGGIIFLSFSFWVSWYTYKLLVYMHEVPDLDCTLGKGVRRLDRYDQLSAYLLGARRGKLVLLPFQLAVLIGIGITYTVVAGGCLQAFAGSVGTSGNKVLGTWAYMIMFGALQVALAMVALAMLPSFDDIRWVSLMGSLMSMAYCIIAFAMSASVKPDSTVNYVPAAVPRSTIDRVMGIFNALTSILFAYGGHNVALEIQATIPVGGRHPLTTIPAMMKGVNVTFLVTGLCYFGVTIAGFHAFGTAVPDNVLGAFAHGSHFWVVSAANLMVVLHVAAAYQVVTMPVYNLIETRLKQARGGVDLTMPMTLGVRLLYVILVTLVAIVIPFFGALMGLIGAIAVTPTTFLLPPLFWIMFKRPRKWGLEWSVNAFLVVVTALLGLMGMVGSLYIIITSWQTFKVFAN